MNSEYPRSSLRWRRSPLEKITQFSPKHTNTHSRLFLSISGHALCQIFRTSCLAMSPEAHFTSTATWMSVSGPHSPKLYPRLQENLFNRHLGRTLGDGSGDMRGRNVIPDVSESARIIAVGTASAIEIAAASGSCQCLSGLCAALSSELLSSHSSSPLCDGGHEGRGAHEAALVERHGMSGKR